MKEAVLLVKAETDGHHFSLTAHPPTWPLPALCSNFPFFHWGWNVTPSKHCKDCSKWTHQGFAGIRHFPGGLTSWKTSQKGELHEWEHRRTTTNKGGSHKDGLVAAFHPKSPGQGCLAETCPQLLFGVLRGKTTLAMRVKTSAQQKEASGAWQHPMWGLHTRPTVTSAPKLSAGCAVPTPAGGPGDPRAGVTGSHGPWLAPAESEAMRAWIWGADSCQQPEEPQVLSGVRWASKWGLRGSPTPERSAPTWWELHPNPGRPKQVQAELPHASCLAVWLSWWPLCMERRDPDLQVQKQFPEWVLWGPTHPAPQPHPPLPRITMNHWAFAGLLALGGPQQGVAGSAADLLGRCSLREWKP